MRRLTDAEQIEALTVLIEDYRDARATPGTDDHVIYLALKKSADDVRARQAEKVGEVARNLTDAVDRMYASKSALGFETGHMRRVAEIVGGSWATIRDALLKFEQNRENHDESINSGSSIR